ncbi:MAG: zinc-ribbon domain-containing protein, partial [Pseudomonadota bacterium]
MIVQCEKCDTSFKLDDTLVPPAGAWVRCSQCQDVFHVDAPDGPPPAAHRAQEPDFFELSDGPSQAARAAETAEFGLEMDEMMEGRDRPKGGKGLKIVFWLLVLPLILVLLAVGALFALDRFHIMPQLVDPVRNLPGLNLIL